MDALIQYILDLFTNPGAAQAFLFGPEQAMSDAGLVNVSPDEFSTAAATAVPGMDFGGDPIGGLRQVLTDQYGDGPNLVSTVAEDGGTLVGDALAPLVYGGDGGPGGFCWETRFGGGATRFRARWGGV